MKSHTHIVYILYIWCLYVIGVINCTLSPLSKLTGLWITSEALYSNLDLSYPFVLALMHSFFPLK